MCSTAIIGNATTSYAGQVLTGRTLHLLTTHAQKAVLRRDGGVS